jgi:hypothetical protein
MEFGNKYFGIDISTDYCALFLFPVGIELFCLREDFEINFTIWPVKLTLGIGVNRTLFR